MTLPADLFTTAVTGSFRSANGRPLQGSVTFTPSATLTDPTGTTVIPVFPVTYSLQSGNFTSDPLLATDNTDTQPPGWAFQVTVALQDIAAYSFATFLPASPHSFTATSAAPCVFTATGSSYGNGNPVILTGGSLPAGFTAGTTYFAVSVSGTSFSLAATAGGSAIASSGTGSGTVTTAYTDISALEPVYPAGTTLGPAGTYLPSGGGTETGTLVLSGSPPLKVPGATLGQILASDASGNFTVQNASSGNATSIDGVTVTGTVASGRTIIATSTSAATWQLPLQVDTTSSDIQPLGSSAVAGNLTQAAAANHVHANTGLVTSGESAGGDLSGTFPASLTVAKIQGTAISSPPGGTSTFLAGNGTWQMPPGAETLTPTAVKTSAYPASPGDFVPVNTTSGAVTVTLPNAPANGTIIGVKLAVLGTGNAVTIARNGSGTDVFNVSGGSTSLTLSRLFQTMVMLYQSGIWYVTSSDPAISLPLAISSGGTGVTASSIYNVKSYGALGNGQYVDTGAITTGTATLTIGGSGATFASTDVGKNIIIYGAGASGIHLGGITITGYTSATQVTVSANASTTVSGAVVVWGTNDATAIQNTVAAAGAGGSVYFPSGIYLTTGGLTNGSDSLNGGRIFGDGPGDSGGQQSFAASAVTYGSTYGSTIVCDPGNVYSWLGSTSPGPREIDHLNIVWTGSGGKIFASVGPIQNAPVIHDCRFEVNDPAGNGQVVASFVESPFMAWERCVFVETAAVRQLPLMQSFSSASGADANITFRSCEWNNFGFDHSQYLCDIEYQGASSGGDSYTMQIAFRDCTFGQAWGGAIKMLGVINPVIDNCGFWDLANTGAPSTGNHTMYFGKYSGSSPCRGVRITGAFKNRPWSVATAAGVYDVYCESSTQGVLIESFSTKPQNQTTGANVNLNFNGCTDVTLIGCQSPTGSNTGTTVIVNPPASGVTILNGAVTPTVPMAISSGGTGAATQQAALTALTGTQSAGQYLRSDGTNSSLAYIQGQDLPSSTGSSKGAVQLIGDLGGTATAPTVVGTHLTVTVPPPTGATATDTPAVTAALSAFTTALASGPATLLFQDGTYQVDSNVLAVRSAANFTIRGTGGAAITQAPNRSALPNNVTGNLLTIADCTDFRVTDLILDGRRDTVSPATPLTASASSGQPSVTVASGQGARYTAGQRLQMFGGLTSSDQNTSESFGVGYGGGVVVSSVTAGGGTGGGDLITFTANLANSYTQISSTAFSDGYGTYAYAGAYLTPYQTASGNSVATRSLSGEDQQNGLHLINCQRFTVRNVTARNLWESGIKCGTGFASGSLSGDGCSQGTITGNTIYHGYDQGVSLWQSDHITVTDNVINAAGWGGVVLSGRTDMCVIKGNQILNSVYRVPNDTSSGHGIAIEAGRRNQVTGNTVTAPFGVGVYLRLAPPILAINAGNSPTLTAFLAEGTASGTSVAVSSTSNLVVGGFYSILDGPRTEALSVLAVVDGTHVTFKEATRFPHASGLYLTVRVAEENEITGNTVINAGQNGIDPLASARCKLRDNIITGWGSTYHGITLGSSNLLLPASLGGDGAIIEGNIISAGPGVPLFAQNVSGMTIRGNRVYNPAPGSSYSGMIFYGVTDSEISANRVSDIEDSQGMFFGLSCARLTITGNTVIRAAYQGILLQVCDSLTVTGNTSCSNGDGIHLQGVTRSAITGNLCVSNSGIGLRVTDSGSSHSLYNRIIGNTARDDGSGISVSTGGAQTQQHGIVEDGSSDYNLFTANESDSNAADQFTTVGTHTVSSANIISGIFSGTTPVTLGGTGQTTAAAALTALGGAAALVPLGSPVTASTVTAAAGQFIQCDTTSNAITVTLPASGAADKSLVGVKMITQGSTSGVPYTVTVSCASGDHFNVASTGGTSLTLSVASQGVLLQYDHALAVWYVLADDIPLGQADIRYGATAGTIGAATGTENLTLSTAATWNVTLAGNTTFAFQGPASPSVQSLTVYVTQAASGGPYSVTWPGSVTWFGGTAPAIATSAAGALTVVTLQTINGGTSWYGGIVSNAALPLPVGDGGTGLNALAAYGLVAGGAGTTSPVQQIGTGSLGQVLTSNGSGALPSFQVTSTPPIWEPADSGLVAWNYDPCITNGGSQVLATAGTLYVMAMKVAATTSVTNIYLDLTANGSGLTHGYAGLWQGAGGALLGVTSDQATSWGSGSTNAAPAMAITGGPVTVTAGVVYVGVWFTGTTGPTFYKTAAQNFVNVGLLAASSRWGTANTGLTTTAPSTLGTIAASEYAYWAAVG